MSTPQRPDERPSPDQGAAARARARASSHLAAATAAKVSRGGAAGGMAQSARVLTDKSSTAGEKAAEGAAAGLEAAATVAGSAVASPVGGKVAGAVVGGVARSKVGKKALKWYAMGVLALMLGVFFIYMTLMTSFVTAFVTSAAQEEAEAAPAVPDASCTIVVPGSGGGAPIVGLNPEQTQNASTIITTTMERGLTPADAVIAVMTAITESSLINVNYGDTAGPDSRGLFQQRDSWGTLAQRMDPPTATGLFLAQLEKNAGRDAVAPWVAAQTVQRSAYSDGSNYRVKYSQALDIVSTRLTEAQMKTVNSEHWLAASGGGAWTPPSGTGGTPAPVQNCTGNSGVPTTGGNTTGAGAWGGHSNGNIPDEAMCVIPFAPLHKMRCDATAALVTMNEAYKRDIGSNIVISDSYRSYAGQVATKASWCARGACNMAATPGTSNHGWALALDLGGGINTSYSTPQHVWLATNGSKYGFENPAWAKPGAGFQKREPWHWEYVRSAT